LTAYPFTTLPEQAEGLRWLADIRQMASAPTVGALVRDLREVTPDTFKLDFLAFGGEEKAPNENELTDFETPNELKVCGRYFQSGNDEVLTGSEALLSVWREKAGAARYIHLAELTPAMNGGFQLSDGALSLDEIRNTELHADMVVITARGTAAQQQQRARAFLDGGAEWVLVTNWDLPDRFRVRYLGNIYDSMNQERPPIRAMSEGGNRMINDGMTSLNWDDPAVWGVFTLFGKP
jgi:CHAT domain-containing protein